MPCDGSYMNPNDTEANRKKIATLICFVDSKLGIETPENVKAASEDYYGYGVELDEVTEHLCTKLSNLTEEQENRIIYNGRNPSSRLLADWWEEHQAADKERLKRELKAAKDEETKAKAIKKLTAHERKVLGIS